MRFHPGEYIADELTARGWTIEQLAATAQYPESILRDVVGRKRGLTKVAADCVGRAFGTSGEIWWRLQQAYDKAEKE